MINTPVDFKYNNFTGNAIEILQSSIFNSALCIDYIYQAPTDRFPPTQIECDHLNLNLAGDLNLTGSEMRFSDFGQRSPDAYRIRGLNFTVNCENFFAKQGEIIMSFHHEYDFKCRLMANKSIVLVDTDIMTDIDIANPNVVGGDIWIVPEYINLLIMSSRLEMTLTDSNIMFPKLFLISQEGNMNLISSLLETRAGACPALDDIHKIENALDEALDKGTFNHDAILDIFGELSGITPTKQMINSGVFLYSNKTINIHTKENHGEITQTLHENGTRVNGGYIFSYSEEL
jgi:hypothetical protein